MKARTLSITGACENNLQNLSLEIPHDELVVVTGISGSGKSSLAFDTVYAEGQRRYIETFSPYTRQFFDKVKRPNVERIEQVRPAVAIQQRTRVLTSRSTVGSMTSLNDYLRVLWAALAEPVCPACGIAFRRWSAADLALHAARLLELGNHATLLICAPVRFKAVNLEFELERLRTLGFARFFDERRGTTGLFEESNPADFRELPRILVVLDRIRRGSVNQKRLRESIEQAFNLSEGVCTLVDPEPTPRRPLAVILNGPHQTTTAPSPCFSEDFHDSFHCAAGEARIAKARPSLFSFNHPAGACPECKGFGRVLRIDPDLCVPNPGRSISEGALQCWSATSRRAEQRRLVKFCESNDIPVDMPWRELSAEHQDLIFNHRSRDYRGVVPWFKRLEQKAYKMHVRVFLARYRGQFECPTCRGTRLRHDALAWRIRGRTLPEIWLMPVEDLLGWVRELERELRASRRLPLELRDVFSAVIARLQYLVDLGLPYLTLDRQSRTLSGGETQRVNLTTALGSELISTHFVLDEPSVGLHARDTDRLVQSMRALQTRGNSLLVVEHDLECIDAADHVVELGPRAGEEGGTIVYNGAAGQWGGIPVTVTPRATPVESDRHLAIAHAQARNLKDLSLTIPLGQMVCLTGVSGSGKSSLVSEVIMAAWERRELGTPPSGPTTVEGFDALDQVLLVDQAPLTKSPRANIATYTGIWDTARTLLAGTEDAALRSLTKSAFSFNVDGGRCPACKGAGFIREDMQFLSDVYIRCELCLGRRFQESVLEVRYKGMNADDLLTMSVERAGEVFGEGPIASMARTMSQLGLGHLSLGHPLSELSGGEAQRLKLVPYIEQSGRGRSLFIFDEPTTGLHVRDTEKLITLLRVLTERGHSVLCVEHNLLVIAAADWIIDLGPEGGERGGRIVLEGTPAAVAQDTRSGSWTARYLREFLAPARRTTSSAGRRSIRPPPEPEAVIITGAREHNLKNIDLSIPLNQVVALTGVSGSGKSSIAKDIVYAEGQRRYLDCLSPYARQYIKELRRPEIDAIRNIPPTICVYQHTFQPSRLSTVATMSEVYNFLRLLLAKTGQQHCPDHPEHRIAALSPAEIATEIKTLRGKSVRILAPLVKLKKGNHRAVLQRAIDTEVSQIRVDGVFLSPASVNVTGGLEKNKPHTIEFVVARFSPASVDAAFIQEGVTQALSLSGGTLIAVGEFGEAVFSIERTCPVCKRGFFKPDPEDLSFNSPRGVCPGCLGTGTDGEEPCPECGGARINALGRNLRLEGENIHQLALRTAPELREFLKGTTLDTRAAAIAAPVLSELYGKLDSLIAMGLDYISLDRGCTTLSGGELQRLRLAAATGSPLSGVLYIFDEPSVGLHPRDNRRVLAELRHLKERGNSVIMIEHDPESILATDYTIDVGPGGGRQGGHIVFAGPTRELVAAENSLTGRAIRRDRAGEEVERAAAPPAAPPRLILRNGRCHNIVDLDLEIPLRSIVTVAGVSGAGKSSLVHGIIGRLLDEGAQKGSTWSLGGTKLTSEIEIARTLLVDQKPIGANSRSTPASYLGIWDEIRKLYANTIEAKARGWGVGFFSYNTGKGRCPECTGQGQIKVEMNFLADAWMVCETCGGRRYNDEAESVRYLDHSISQVLGLTFEEARLTFVNHRRIVGPIRQAVELGLGYLTLGQSSTSLSGGESQRLKLVAELSAKRHNHTLYILDEPTTGLHKVDVARLMTILRDLVALGHSVLLIEHDQDVLGASDHVIELGPGPGAAGGKVIFSGPPAKLAKALSPWGDILRGSRAGTETPPPRARRARSRSV